MKHVLHIKTRQTDELLAEIILQDGQSDTRVEVVDLAKVKDVDYQQLLEAVFRADVVECW